MAALAVPASLNIDWRVTNGDYEEFLTPKVLAMPLRTPMNGSFLPFLLMWAEKWFYLKDEIPIVGCVEKQFIITKIAALTCGNMRPTDVIRWDEKSGLQAGCCRLPSYRRARSARDKGDRQ